MYLITKLQNLKAIHNNRDNTLNAKVVVSNYKITKSESYSQLYRSIISAASGLYLITKLQNLKAIHNFGLIDEFHASVVSNYKITKSESYSQPQSHSLVSEIVVSNYKITKSESYSQLYVI